MEKELAAIQKQVDEGQYAFGVAPIKDVPFWSTFFLLMSEWVYQTDYRDEKMRDSVLSIKTIYTRIDSDFMLAIHYPINDAFHVFPDRIRDLINYIEEQGDQPK